MPGVYVNLVCAKCGDKPTPLEAQYTARLGKTHWRRILRDGIDSARACGPWIGADFTPEARQKVIDDWHAARAAELR